MHANMKTLCKTAYWCFVVCKIRCIVNSGTLLSTECSALGCFIQASVTNRLPDTLLAFLWKTQSFHLCQHCVNQLEHFYWGISLNFLPTYTVECFKNLPSVILRQGRATHRWKEILTSKIAIARDSFYLSSEYTAIEDILSICSNSCDSYTYLPMGGQALSSE